jgi:hypothetical protein
MVSEERNFINLTTWSKIFLLVTFLQINVCSIQIFFPSLEPEPVSIVQVSS